MESGEEQKVSPRRARLRQLYATLYAPDDADAANVKAEFKDGMLTVHLPKSEKAKPKQIQSPEKRNESSHARQRKGT
jgi:HSP20 family molecular chaperone IbpA